MTGISAFGGYVPRLRLSRKVLAQAHAWHNAALAGLGKGERAMANWDEDAVTMAVEAARDALGDRDRGSLAAVHLASTSLPFQDRLNAGIVAAALNLPDAIQSLDVTGTQRAGTSGLIAAFQAAQAAAGPILFVASERRKMKPGSPGEFMTGDAAAAFVITPEEGVARLLAHHSVTLDFVDHYRGAEADFDYNWEERWVRDEGWAKILPPAVEAVLAKAGKAVGDIDALLIPGSIRGLQARMARVLGFPAEAVAEPLLGELGEAGAAHPLVMLSHTLQSIGPGKTVLVIGFGNGADALILETTPALAEAQPQMGIRGFLARRKPEENYIKYLAFRDLLPIERGIREEREEQTPLSSLYRHRKTVLGLVGGKCKVTGTVQFPMEPYSVNPQNHALHSQEEYPLADKPATVMTYTADNLAFTPEPPQHYGMITFAEGGRMMADITDVEPGQVDVGMPLRMMFRIKLVDDRRGFTRYFWKAVPAFDT